MNRDTANEPRGVIAMVGDAVGQAAELIQLEFRLARTEIAEKLTALRAGLALIVVGVILMTASLFLLLQSAVHLLVQAGLSPTVATLIVALACVLVGFLFISSGRKHLEPEALAPKRTMNELARDSALIKEKLT